jgi:hypothetical protein
MLVQVRQSVVRFACCLLYNSLGLNPLDGRRAVLRGGLPDYFPALGDPLRQGKIRSQLASLFYDDHVTVGFTGRFGVCRLRSVPLYGRTFRNLRWLLATFRLRRSVDGRDV